MKKVYIVRHGQTDNNAEGLVQSSETPLSEKGKKQAQALGERFKHIKFDRLFSSDYIRARETAEGIAKATEKPIELTPLLREMKRPSQFIGKSNTTPEYLAFLKTVEKNVDDPKWHFADDENFFDVLSRVEEFFGKLETIENDCVVVTHGRMAMMMTLYVVMGMKLTPEIWKVAMKNLLVATNTGITVIIFNDKTQTWQLDSYNDRAHFAE